MGDQNTGIRARVIKHPSSKEQNSPFLRSLSTSNMISRLLFRRTLRAQLHDEVLKGYSAIKSKPFLKRKQVDGITPFRVLTVDIHPLKVAPSSTLPDDVPTPLILEHDKSKDGNVNHHRASYDGVQYLHYANTDHNSQSLPAIRARCAGKSDWSSPLFPGRSPQTFKRFFLCVPADNVPHVVIVSDKSAIQNANIFGGVPVVRCCPRYMAENNGALRQLIDDAVTTNLVEKMNSATWTSAYWLGAAIGGVSAIMFGWAH